MAQAKNVLVSPLQRVHASARLAGSVWLVVACGAGLPCTCSAPVAGVGAAEGGGEPGQAVEREQQLNAALLHKQPEHQGARAQGVRRAPDIQLPMRSQARTVMQQGLQPDSCCRSRCSPGARHTTATQRSHLAVSADVSIVSSMRAVGQGRPGSKTEISGQQGGQKRSRDDWVQREEEALLHAFGSQLPPSAALLGIPRTWPCPHLCTSHTPQGSPQLPGLQVPPPPLPPPLPPPPRLLLLLQQPARPAAGHPALQLQAPPALAPRRHPAAAELAPRHPCLPRRRQLAWRLCPSPPPPLQALLPLPQRQQALLAGRPRLQQPRAPRRAV